MELEKLQEDLALLAFSVSGTRLPARSRDRLMAAIAKEPRRARLPRGASAAWWNALGWVAAVAAILVGVFLRKQNSHPRQRVAELENSSSKQELQLIEASKLLAVLTSLDATHFTIVAAKTPPQPQGKAIYVQGSSTLVFMASNMPAAPPRKVYELWLIPANGAPISFGFRKR